MIIFRYRNRKGGKLFEKNNKYYWFYFIKSKYNIFN